MNSRWTAIFSNILDLIKSRAEWLIIFFALLVFVFVYWLLSTKQREWSRDYFIPILFFMTLAGRTLWRAIFVISKWTGKPSFLILISINNLLVLIFMTFTIISYLIRSKPLNRAVGLKERAFPLFVVLFHLVGSHFIAAFIKLRFNVILYISGIFLSMIGITLDCLAMWTLKRSFSIMVEARPLIKTGIYGKIRHPLYAGELIHFFGISMLFNHGAAYGMFLALVIMQILRAKLEERKLMAHFPEYANYRKQTGFFLPKFRQAKTMASGVPYI